MFPDAMRKKQTLLLLGDLAILALALLIPRLSQFLLNAGPPCVFARRGFLCPSCGGTRCVRYFFTGRFSQAFAMNPFIFILILYGIFWLFLVNLSCFTRWKPAQKAASFMVSPGVVISFAIAFALFGILRNF